MSTLSNTVSAARVPVLADSFANTWVKNAALVFGGALFMVLCQQISIAVPPSPVPITGGTLGVMLIGSALGSKRGVSAMGLYLLMGLFLPVYSEGREGIDVLVNSASSGYFLGFLVSSYVVGWLAERGGDRKFMTAFISFVFAQLIIFGFGLAGLKLNTGEEWGWVIHNGFTIFIIGGLVKAAIGAAAMPAAWKLSEKTR
ncbi:MAG: biotin transporter BioY [Solirubrobacterales bacterium]|mgnify:CR=1 FL=1|nr:biotin transporter BioY [Solirubrobacterales bacterium]MCB0862802.1 biotin transporter BioY [Solirubrobacterales bacterium]HRV60686.1 biotin transporter BioY [Solirubrobacterales bacterium]